MADDGPELPVFLPLSPECRYHHTLLLVHFDQENGTQRSLLGSDRSGIYTHSLTLIMATECDKPGSGEKCYGQVLGDSGQAQSLIPHQHGSCLVSRKERKMKRKQLSKCLFLSDPGAVSPQLC